MVDVARVRRVRTLYDLALGHLVDLDQDTRTVVGDLLAKIGIADHSRVDRWLASTEALVEDACFAPGVG